MDELAFYKLRVERLRADVVKMRDQWDPENYTSKDRFMPLFTHSSVLDALNDALDDDDELTDWWKNADG